jgi:hypothetical protein
MIFWAFSIVIMTVGLPIEDSQRLFANPPPPATLAEANTRKLQSLSRIAGVVLLGFVRNCANQEELAKIGNLGSSATVQLEYRCGSTIGPAMPLMRSATSPGQADGLMGTASLSAAPL